MPDVSPISIVAGPKPKLLAYVDTNCLERETALAPVTQRSEEICCWVSCSLFAIADECSAAAAGRSKDRRRTWATSMHWSSSGAVRTAESSAAEDLLRSFAAGTAMQDSESILEIFCFATQAAFLHSSP